MCGCSGTDRSSTENSIKIFTESEIQQLARDIRSTVQLIGPVRTSVVRIATVNGGLYLIVNSNTSTGEISLQLAGIPITVRFDARLTFALPRVSGEIELVFVVGGTEVYTVTASIDCADVTKPETCNITFQQTGGQEIVRGCTSCLKKCSLSCFLTCGTDETCWAVCSIACWLRCCA